MTQHAENLEAPRFSRASLKSIVFAAIVALVATIGFVVWKSAKREADVRGGQPSALIRPMTGNECIVELNRQGIDYAETRPFFEDSKAVSDWATRLTAGKASPKEKADTILAYVRAQKARGAFVPWAFSEPRNEAIESGTEVLARLENPAQSRMYPLEVAWFVVRALRAVNITAMLSEIYSISGAAEPPDPTGHFGYFGVAIYPGRFTDGVPMIVDAYNAGSIVAEKDATRVLSDIQALGAIYNAQAMHRLIVAQDLSAALVRSDAAIKLDPNSPNTASVHGAIAMALGSVASGIEDIERAAKLREDGPRITNLAAAHLAAGDTAKATVELSRVVEAYPKWASAHATLAAAYLTTGDLEKAKKSIALAEQFDPSLYMLLALKANIAMNQNDAPRAIALLKKAVEIRPNDLQTRLNLAQIYRAAGDKKSALEEVERIRKMAPQNLLPQLEPVLAAIISEQADAPSDAIVDPGQAMPQTAPTELELGSGRGSKLHLNLNE